MPGFDNNVVYAGNLDFSGTSPVTAQVTTDGQTLIGSTVAPNVRVGIPTGSLGITVTPGAGSLDISYTGSRVEQVVYASNSTLVTCSTLIPNDDTTPQITEGDQILTATITPKNSANLLFIEATIPYYAAVGGAKNVFALFQDAGADAIAACLYAEDNISDYPNQVAILRYVMAAGTTSATTFQVRGGQGAGGGSLVVNANGATGLLALGGTQHAVLMITEFKPA
jgi:hypothetical protein